MSDNGNLGTLVRSKLWFDGGFTMIPNAWVRDPHLTPEALGVLVKLTSHEPGFEVSIRGMAAGSPVGVDAIRTAVGELERRGYLKRYRRRERGRIKGTNWHLFDPFAPVDKSNQLDFPGDPLPPMGTKNPRSEPQPVGPHVVQPEMEEPRMENPTTKEDQLNQELQVVTDATTDAREAVVVPECHHEKIPGDGRCLFACAVDSERQRLLRAQS